MSTAVHKDFHGAMSYGLTFLQRQYGDREMEDYLRQVGRVVYSPLSRALRERGLVALEEHWRRIFTLEGGDFDLRYEGEALVLEVRRCPAIHHMRQRGYHVADRYCEHTRLVNDEICRAAGYQASVQYDQAAGRCIQRFWRP
ncbi:MAG: hypothetical protein FJ279_08395 [Planctomycetes bacterium]|nr:hypothetical protein [Planctomycetota bacterium]MBM4079354.1 hypothetical protein [Planctomycetota bacterium]MBM4084290.1 hypothetical protein [Planctomycetota bacterium]